MTGSWRVVGRLVRGRRERLGLTQEDIARTSLISDKTLRRIEHGEAPERGFRPSTIVKLEQALDWPRGAVRSILDGEGNWATWVHRPDADESTSDAVPDQYVTASRAVLQALYALTEVPTTPQVDEAKRVLVDTLNELQDSERQARDGG